MQAKLTLKETLGWVIDQLRAAGQSMVPDAEQLNILTERMEAQTQAAQDAFHAALSDECAIQNPKHPELGKLPQKRAKLEERDGEGKEWTKELEGTPAPTDDRRAELERWLDQCETDCDKLESDIGGLEALLGIRQETTALRKAAYEEAKRDLKKLKQVAPSILAKTEALVDAKRDKLAAIAADKTDDTAGALIAELEEDLAKAENDNAAADIIVDEDDDDGEIDLDEVVAKEKARKAGSRRTRWSSNAATQDQQTQ